MTQSSQLQEAELIHSAEVQEYIEPHLLSPDLLVLPEHSVHCTQEFFNLSTGDQHIQTDGLQSRTTFEKTLTELSAVELTSSNFFISPSKSDGPLPDDVRSSVEMMLQQNSVDYCRNFEELITTIETPSKTNSQSAYKIQISP